MKKEGYFESDPAELVSAGVAETTGDSELESPVYYVVLSELARGSIGPAQAFDDLIETRQTFSPEE